MTYDKNGVLIQIGDIVKIEGSPIKSDNATYIVEQDGTSELYSGTGLTLLKVAKTKNGYRLSKSSYNLCFYPLCNFSNKYKFSKSDMMKNTTIEIVKQANPEMVTFTEVERHVHEEFKQPCFYASITEDEKRDITVSYSTNQTDKLKAFLSNVDLKPSEKVDIKQMDMLHNWGRRSYIDYQLVTEVTK